MISIYNNEFLCSIFTAIVQRTCAKFALDDCKTANSNHFCYCNRPLCNGENAESIIEKFGDVTDDEEDNDEPNADEGSGSEEDDEDYKNNRSLNQKTGALTTTTEENKIATLSVSTAATQSTINEAVNFNLNTNLQIFLIIARLFDAYRRN